MKYTKVGLEKRFYEQQHHHKIFQGKINQIQRIQSASDCVSIKGEGLYKCGKSFLIQSSDDSFVPTSLCAVIKEHQHL